MAEEKKASKKNKATVTQKKMRLIAGTTAVLMLATTGLAIQKKASDFQNAAFEIVGSQYSQAASGWPLIPGYKAIPHNKLYKSKWADVQKLSSDIESVDYYQENRKSFSDFLNKSHRDPAINERVMITKSVIQQLSKIDDLSVKTYNVNYFVNTAFQYDDMKAKGSWSEAYGYWDNAPQETVAVGKGVCVDQVKLKAEMLISSGMPEKDLTFITLQNKKNNKYHQVLRVDGKEYGGLILDGGKSKMPYPEADLFDRSFQYRIVSMSDASGDHILLKRSVLSFGTDAVKSQGDAPGKRYKAITQDINDKSAQLKQKYGDQEVPYISGQYKIKPSSLDNG